jgi:hypothetical protein
MFRSQMQRGVALVTEVGVPDVRGVVAYDALDEGNVVEEDGAPEAARDVNPEVHVREAGPGIGWCVGGVWVFLCTYIVLLPHD